MAPMQKIQEYLKKIKAKQKPGQTLEDVLNIEMDNDSFPHQNYLTSKQMMLGMLSSTRQQYVQLIQI